MKLRPLLIIECLIYLAIYPLLLLMLIVTGLVCGLPARLLNTSDEATSAPYEWRLVELPTAPSSPTNADSPANAEPITTEITGGQPSLAHQAAFTGTTSVPSPASVNQRVTPQVNGDNQKIAQADLPSNAPGVTPAAIGSEGVLPSPTLALDFSVFVNQVDNTQPSSSSREPAATSAPEGVLSNLIIGLIDVISQSSLDFLPASAPSPTSLPTLTPTPLPSATPSPTITLTPTETPLPTNTPIPTLTPTRPPTPLPTATATPTFAPTATPAPAPTDTPLPSPTPFPEYDFLLNEFYNSPTTNHFLVIYVAVVDINEIPIGDMKVVGTRLDHNLTYESPLTTWHYEGYNAPGEHIKSGNTKFEPPGGIETTSWVLHLVDAHGNRMSDEVRFDVDENNRQWYFIKFKRKS